jgi:hypothetical protein
MNKGGRKWTHAFFHLVGSQKAEDLDLKGGPSEE